MSCSGIVEPTSELLWLATSVIRDQQRTVVCDELLLYGVLGVLIDELLVVCDDGLADGLTDGVDLGSVSTTGNANSDVDICELLEANDEKGLVDLESQDLWLNEVEGLAVNLDESFSCLFPQSCQHASFPILVWACWYSHLIVESYLAVGDGGSC